jgi:hypothetical protein
MNINSSPLDDHQLWQLMEANLQQDDGTVETGADLGADFLHFHTKVDVDARVLFGIVYLEFVLVPGTGGEV